MSHYLRAWSDTGWTDWAATVRSAADLAVANWVWADLRGFHHAGTLPSGPPITGCLWGWAAGQAWVRLRVDIPQGAATRVCGAVLTAGDPGAGDRVAVLAAENVPVFRPRHMRGGGMAYLDGRVVRCLRVVDRPLTFVELV